MHRKLVAAICGLVLLPLLSYAMTIATWTFSDVLDGSWYKSYVEQAAQFGIVSGYKDANGNFTGRFGPENSVTVAESLKMALEGAGYDESIGQGYGHWAARYVSIALGQNFEFTHQPISLDRPATRAEVASMVADAFRAPHLAVRGDVFYDVPFTTAYASAIEALARVNILTGDTDASGNRLGRFRPTSAVNRAEAVKMVMEARTVFGTPGENAYNFSSSFTTSNNSSTSKKSSSSTSAGSCTLSQCGPAPAVPNWQCSDGSVAGPSCERLPDSRCGWLIRQCPTMSSSWSSSRSSSSSSRSGSSSSYSSSRSASSSSYSVQTYTVKYTNNGFQPSFIAIKFGDIITFKSEAVTGMWVASNPHPTHVDYPEFDMHQAGGSGSVFSFGFGKVGTWGYHNHQNPNHQAVVSVDPR